MTAIPVTTPAALVRVSSDVQRLKASYRGFGVSFMRLRGAGPIGTTTGLSQRRALALLASPGGAARVIYDDASATGKRCDIAEGDVLLVDLRRPSHVSYSGQGELLRADIPFTALRAFALQHGWRDLPDLTTGNCGHADVTLSALMVSLGPYFDDSRQRSTLVVDQVAMALLGHLLFAYARREQPISVPKGRLAGWQERRARDLIDEHLAGDVSVEWLAKQCGLSESYFARAFRETVGMPPYQWMIERRVQRAKDLMHDRALTLTDVALSCGFADQSHFSRAFSRVAGVPPGVWRRNMVVDP